MFPHQVAIIALLVLRSGGECHKVSSGGSDSHVIVSGQFGQAVPISSDGSRGYEVNLVRRSVRPFTRLEESSRTPSSVSRLRFGSWLRDEAGELHRTLERRGIRRSRREVASNAYGLRDVRSNVQSLDEQRREREARRRRTNNTSSVSPGRVREWGAGQGLRLVRPSGDLASPRVLRGSVGPGSHPRGPGSGSRRSGHLTPVA